MADLLPPGFVFHQSNLQAFQTCRFSFLLRYVRKLPWPAPLASRGSSFENDLIAGSMLHSLIHQYFLGIDRQNLISCAVNFPDTRVKVWFENFLTSPYAKTASNQFPEHTMQITLDGSLLLAKFDLVRFDSDTIQIWDWKTSRVLPKRHFLQDRIQTKVYSLVAASAHIQSSRAVTMHYWEASFPDQTITLEIAESQLSKYEEDLINMITLIRSLKSDQFERTQKLTNCSYCEYQSYCLRSGQAADEELFDDWFEIGMSDLQG
jgi:CRISPR/Cas system-associated exonuclease Cas4 (RecB family)